MKLLILAVTCMATLNAHAKEATGYWAHYQTTIIHQDGSLEQREQIKEVLSVSSHPKEYLIQVTDILSDGSVEVEQKTQRSFRTPEQGQELVRNCKQFGGSIVKRSYQGEFYIDTCMVDAFSFAAVPFGVFESRWHINGADTTQMLIDHGKKD